MQKNLLITSPAHETVQAITEKGVCLLMVVIYLLAEDLLKCVNAVIKHCTVQYSLAFLDF